jgi:membrane protein DedA with SNARE-associated domain
MTTHIPSSLIGVAPYITHYGYLAVFALVMIEDFGIPLPGETVLIAAAVFAGLGKLSIWWVIIIGLLAAIAGDNIGYLIGRSGGHRLLVKYGKYIFITNDKLEKLEQFFERNGAKIVVVARFIEGLRQVNGILAGTTKMKWRKFVIYNALGAGLWVITWSMLGYFGSSYINVFLRYATDFAYLAAIGVVVYIFYRIIRSHKG